jgi:hypothetical protein
LRTSPSLIVLVVVLKQLLVGKFAINNCFNTTTNTIRLGEVRNTSKVDVGKCTRDVVVYLTCCKGNVMLHSRTGLGNPQ